MTRDPPFRFVDVVPNSDHVGLEEKQPRDEEGLRLVKAFFEIRYPDIRNILVPPVERLSAHFCS